MKERQKEGSAMDKLLNDPNKYERYLKEKEEWEKLDEEERTRQTAELEMEFQNKYQEY